MSPASVAPEPSEQASSGGAFLPSRAEDRRPRTDDWSQPWQRASPLACPRVEKLAKEARKRRRPYLVLHVSPASGLVVFIYSGVGGASPRPRLLIVCQSSPEAEGRRLPSPSRRPLAGHQNRRLPQPMGSRRNSSALERNQSEREEGGPNAGLQIQLKHFPALSSSDSERVPMVTTLFQL